jgi:SAM-dependent methyltransferase
MRTDHLYAKYYYSCPEFVDGTKTFHRLIQSQVKSGSLILEVGSGPTNPTSKYLATLGTLIGVDISREVKTNIALKEAHVFDGTRLPFSDGQFDACVSDWVIEHVHDPFTHFREVARTLKVGGVYCFRTPNQWHYFTLGSKLLPYSAHLRIANKLRNLPAGAHDPYSTAYRANTRPRIRRLCAGTGLAPVTLVAIEKEPSYGRCHPALFYPMFAYERLVNSCNALQVFRASILAALRKPGRAG